MSERFVNDEVEAVEPVPLVLPLDRDTMLWLAEMAGGCDLKAAEIVASMIRCIRVDDQAAHRNLH